MNNHDLTKFLKFVASSFEYRELLNSPVHLIDYGRLWQLAQQHNVQVSIDELRRAVRQFKRLAEDPFDVRDNDLLS